MNILMASGVPKRREGGVAGTIYNFGREMEGLGHQVSYLFQEDLVEPGSVASRFAELIFSLRLQRYIARNRAKFSIVNLHAPVGFAYGWGRRWSGSGDPPYVMTLHGLEERRVHVMKREAQKGRAWHFAWRNRVWHRLYIHPRFRWSISSADGAAVFSRDTATILELKYDLDPERVAVIPPGVETRFVTPRQYHEDGVLRILFVGTWLDQLGIYYLREALKNLDRQLPEWTMTFAGCGVPEGEVRAFFGDDLKERIVVRGTVQTAEMPALYGEHDIFLFPSLLEGLPLVVMEAMAGGMPVITTNTCGMPDVVQDGITGLLIAPANAEEIEKAVIRLAQSKTLREQLGRAAQDSIKHYTWERSARRLEVFFEHILELTEKESR
jgi:glycosyltransferase involved in cell wall biosynthesis